MEIHVCMKKQRQVNCINLLKEQPSKILANYVKMMMPYSHKVSEMYDPSYGILYARESYNTHSLQRDLGFKFK